MIDGSCLAESIRTDTRFFLNEVKQFEATEGDYRPTPEMFSVNEQIRHVADTLDWFRDAGWGSGWDMNFEARCKTITAGGTLADAVAELNAATERLVNTVKDLSSEQINEILPDNPIMGKVPKAVLIEACKDHTAHHRGALSVYLRLLGRTPKMPYMD